MASVHGGALSQWAFPLLLVDIVRVDSGSLGGEEWHRSFNHCIKIHTLGDKKSKARRQLIDSFQGLMGEPVFWWFAGVVLWLLLPSLCLPLRVLPPCVSSFYRKGSHLGPTRLSFYLIVFATTGFPNTATFLGLRG